MRVDDHTSHSFCLDLSTRYWSNSKVEMAYGGGVRSKGLKLRPNKAEAVNQLNHLDTAGSRGLMNDKASTDPAHKMRSFYQCLSQM